jgi:pimeloyl-ACP methyl ester carboxylesterase
MQLTSTSATTTYHRMTVDGVGVFYREAGPKDAPAIVLLHGFPSSSREFDTLIPLLATRYHSIAPDFPGFGHSEAPPASSYPYTFDNLAKTTNALLEQLKINKYSFLLHDYGGPVGFRIMLAHPQRLQALIIQNANVYKEGLGAKWAGIAQYWADPKAHPEVFDAFVSLPATEQRHTLGTSHPERYNPDAWTDEYAHLSEPNQREIQADLLYDYRTNVASYPAWQAWLREHKPPTLLVWGRNDPSFIAAGGEAFKRDLPDAEIHLLDAGHFALDEKNDEIASLILEFLAKHSVRPLGRLSTRLLTLCPPNTKRSGHEPSTSRAEHLSNATAGWIFGGALHHRCQRRTLSPILRKSLRRADHDHGQQRGRAGVHPDREHVAHCLLRGRPHTRQADGNAQRSLRSRCRQQLYEYPRCGYSRVL